MKLGSMRQYDEKWDIPHPVNQLVQDLQASWIGPMCVFEQYDRRLYSCRRLG